MSTQYTFSPEFHQAWDQVSERRSAARSHTVAEMRRFLPTGCTEVIMQWSSDIDSGRLHLHQLRAADGTILQDDPLDTDDESWDALDELSSYLADDWEDASSGFFRAGKQHGASYEPDLFRIDFTDPEVPA